MVGNNITAEEKEKLTIALQNKCNEPDITFNDVFHGINNIHPAFSIKQTYPFIPGALIVIASLIMMIFSEPHSNWYVVGLIVYVLGVVIECVVAYAKTHWQGMLVTLAISVLLGFIVKNRDVDFEWLIEEMKDIF